jgi:hypothetical protein
MLMADGNELAEKLERAYKAMSYHLRHTQGGKT